MQHLLNGGAKLGAKLGRAIGGGSAAVCCLAAMLARGHCAPSARWAPNVPRAAPGFALAPRPAARPKRNLAHMPCPHRALGTQLRSINALTLCTHDMRKACDFYAKLGLVATFGGPDSDFTTFSAHAPVTSDNNALHVNLFVSETYVPPEPGRWNGWGRCVFLVQDVDALHASLAGHGILAPQPKDAPWGERFFHVLDPDGHELSFATPDYGHPRWQRR